MFHFQSLFELTICGQPEIRFQNFEFHTEDEALAAKIRRNSRFGIDVWEEDADTLKVQAAETMAKLGPKRRGRPPKVKIIDGMRTSEPKENQE
jgi:hypothetical protein